MATYAHPETLVETDWVKDNLGKPGVKLVEIDVDTKAYDTGHLPGAIGFNWQTELQDQVCRDIITKEQFDERRHEWLPSEADKQFVQSLMQKPVIDPRQMANWIAAPKQGIRGRAVDFEYVRREA